MKTKLQYYLPKMLITKFFGWLAEKKAGIITYWIILFFIKIYKINLKEIKTKDIKSYNTFNDFFSRRIKIDCRRIDYDPSIIICPADGIITNFGYIENTEKLQLKNHNYTLKSLLAQNETMIDIFQHGIFFTTYLSPKNYHRIHMPCDGSLIKMIYVPGQLFSVNLKFYKNISNIFSKNERVICLFKTNFGYMIQILVGSIISGTISTSWYGKINYKRDGIIKLWKYNINSNNKPIFLKKGDEMGFFTLGSTVITLFSKKNILIKENLSNYKEVRVGDVLAYGIQNVK
ncbi:psd [Wigglesworthia glossinidia endosymbiont of Glossina brevipalpis]|uniref:Phosphatidylserine decarboxylase proenzyme n=1 Tax=Wigglesworthia glossinidia brevipalpis TaxID=36870 RepID=PSD_WIGBR|nr:RecName: Full=Phosphatidylserine decarboxylase proenzyme; Contains: RecName: Full=Phosphatidylserine decarboxylase alpha chain; Contains: RecName: Full=Phosphatidylserine decarboxylase beta chain [Wigglesworthia glossinidia endosymbiont of Glossina brevipalpis]BAC24574.1 psd [Wigglesworthia glossinidia endosymbiont of Glossina brevipalpis]